MEPLTILMNAEAGLGGSPAVTRLARALADHGIVGTIEVVEPARLTGRIQELSGHRWLGIAGGDGTQRSAARALAGTGTVLVPFPTGRLNHFARRLGLDTVEATARALGAGRIHALPLGRANGHLFVNTAVVGSYVRLIRLRERLRPYLTTWPAAGAAALAVLGRWEDVEIEVRSDGWEGGCATSMFWVGIGPGSFPSPHRAPLPGPDPRLELVLLRGPGRGAVLRLLGGVARDRLGRPPGAGPGIELFAAPSVTIEAENRLHVALDGEPHVLTPPLRIGLEGDALRTLAPG